MNRPALVSVLVGLLAVIMLGSGCIVGRGSSSSSEIPEKQLILSRSVRVLADGHSQFQRRLEGGAGATSDRLFLTQAARATLPCLTMCWELTNTDRQESYEKS